MPTTVEAEAVQNNEPKNVSDRSAAVHACLKRSNPDNITDNGEQTSAKRACVPSATASNSAAATSGNMIAGDGHADRPSMAHSMSPAQLQETIAFVQSLVEGPDYQQNAELVVIMVRDGLQISTDSRSSLIAGLSSPAVANRLSAFAKMRIAKIFDCDR
jgi:hypothetical protein